MSNSIQNFSEALKRASENPQQNQLGTSSYPTIYKQDVDHYLVSSGPPPSSTGTKLKPVELNELIDLINERVVESLQKQNQELPKYLKSLSDEKRHTYTKTCFGWLKELISKVHNLFLGYGWTTSADRTDALIRTIQTKNKEFEDAREKAATLKAAALPAEKLTAAKLTIDSLPKEIAALPYEEVVPLLKTLISRAANSEEHLQKLHAVLDAVSTDDFVKFFTSIYSEGNVIFCFITNCARIPSTKWPCEERTRLVIDAFFERCQKGSDNFKLLDAVGNFLQYGTVNDQTGKEICAKLSTLPNSEISLFAAVRYSRFHQLACINFSIERLDSFINEIITHLALNSGFLMQLSKIAKEERSIPAEKKAAIEELITKYRALVEADKKAKEQKKEKQESVLPVDQPLPAPTLDNDNLMPSLFDGLKMNSDAKILASKPHPQLALFLRDQMLKTDTWKAPTKGYCDVEITERLRDIFDQMNDSEFVDFVMTHEFCEAWGRGLRHPRRDRWSKSCWPAEDRTRLLVNGVIERLRKNPENEHYFNLLTSILKHGTINESAKQEICDALFSLPKTLWQPILTECLLDFIFKNFPVERLNDVLNSSDHLNRLKKLIDRETNPDQKLILSQKLLLLCRVTLFPPPPADSRPALASNLKLLEEYTRQQFSWNSKEFAIPSMGIASFVISYCAKHIHDAYPPEEYPAQLAKLLVTIVPNVEGIEKLGRTESVENERYALDSAYGPLTRAREGLKIHCRALTDQFSLEDLMKAMEILIKEKRAQVPSNLPADARVYKLFVNYNIMALYMAALKIATSTTMEEIKRVMALILPIHVSCFQPINARNIKRLTNAIQRLVPPLHGVNMDGFKYRVEGVLRALLDSDLDVEIVHSLFDLLQAKLSISYFYRSEWGMGLTEEGHHNRAEEPDEEKIKFMHAVRQKLLVSIGRPVEGAGLPPVIDSTIAEHVGYSDEESSQLIKERYREMYQLNHP